MADEKKTAKPAAKAAPVLGDAGASTDPRVHQLLADLQTAELNGDKQAADKAEAALTELGVAL
jgi:hypothetical protein